MNEAVPAVAGADDSPFDGGVAGPGRIPLGVRRAAKFLNLDYYVLGLAGVLAEMPRVSYNVEARYFPIMIITLALIFLVSMVAAQEVRSTCSEVLARAPCPPRRQQRAESRYNNGPR